MDIHRVNGAKGNGVGKHEHLMLRYLSRDRQLTKPFSATAVLRKAGMLLYFFSLFVLIYAGGESNVHCNEVKMSLFHVASTA